jgi:hypothetical protein
MAESEKTLAQRWMDLFGEEGYRPHLELHDEHPERSRICFKAEGIKYLLYLDEKDPTFFNLSLSYELGLHAGVPDFLLLKAAGDESRETKGTKVNVDLEERSASFNLEWFSEALPTPKMLERMVRQLVYSSDRFFTRLRGAKRPVVLAS